MRIKTCSTYAEFYEDDREVLLCRYSYKELGIDINSRIAWDSNTLAKKIRTGYQNLDRSHQQLNLFS